MRSSERDIVDNAIEEIKSLVVPETVRKISYGAFNGFKSVC